MTGEVGVVDGGAPTWRARSIALFVIGTFFLGICGNGLGGALAVNTDPWLIVLSVVVLVVLLAVHLGFVLGVTLTSPIAVIALLAAQIVLVVLPVLTFGDTWMGLPGFAVGTALIVLPFRAGVCLSLLILGGATALQWQLDPTPRVVAYSVAGCAVIGMTVYGLTRFAVLAAELAAARQARVHVAVAEQRQTFDDELQSALGRRLSEISLLGGLALRRLSGGDTRRAADHVERVLGISRRALADVRSIASRYRTLSLEGEVTFVEHMLESAGVRPVTHVEADVATLPEPVQRVLAESLREAVTNVLRHSDATSCSIVLEREGDTVRLTVVNDGAGPDADDGDPSHVRMRLGACGSTVRTTRTPDGEFGVTVSVPLGPPESAGSPRRAGRPGATATRPITRVTRGLVVAVFLGYYMLAVIRTLGNAGSPGAAAATILCETVVLGIELMFAWSHRWTRALPTAFGLLAVMALMFVTPLLWMPDRWSIIPAGLVGCLLVVLGLRRGAVAGGAVVATAVVTGLLGGSSTEAIVFDLVSTVNCAVAIWGMVLLSGLLTEIDRTRADMARLAVANERVRFAQDVHDLLGLSLSSITLVGEVTHRLIDRDPDTAQSHLNQVLGISDQALDEIYSVAGGSHDVPLQPELARIVDVMRAANIAVCLDAEPVDVDVPLQALLVAALRESFTNMLRHSDADACTVTVRRSGADIELDVVNDGVPAERVVGHTSGGNGLENLAHRVGSRGGTVQSGTRPDGTFRLQVRVPRDVPEPTGVRSSPVRWRSGSRRSGFARPASSRSP